MLTKLQYLMSLVLIYIRVEHLGNTVSFIFGWELKILHSSSSIMSSVFLSKGEDEVERTGGGRKGQ